jgi:hypothetical protein
MNIEFDNLSFEQTLVSELEPDFEMRRKSKRRGMKQVRVSLRSRKLPKGRSVYGKSGRKLTGSWIRRPKGGRI